MMVLVVIILSAILTLQTKNSKITELVKTSFLKVTGTGDIIYTKMLGGSNDDFAYDIIKKNKEELVIVGAADLQIKILHMTIMATKDIWVVDISKTGKIKNGRKIMVDLKMKLPLKPYLMVEKR